MKLGLLALLVFLAGCVAPRPYPPTSRPYPTQPMDNRGTPYESRSVIIENRGAASSVRQDAYECERQAAIAGVAGAKAEAFNRCMRERGHLP